MELDGELVHISFGESWGGQVDLDLDWDPLSKAVALWSSEGQEDLIDLVSTNHVVKNGQWDLELLLVLSLDFLLNWDVENLNWENVLSLVIIQGEVAALLPWPVGIVENLNLSDDALSWDSLNHSFWFLDKCGSLVLPHGLLALAEFLHVLLDLFWVLSHLLTEFRDHLLELWTSKSSTAHSTAATATTTATTHSAASTAHASPGKAVGELTHKVLEVTLLVLGVIFLLLIKDGDKDIWGSTSLLDLQEWVLMVESLLTELAVVEVLQHTALVADSHNWANTAPIASHIGVDNLALGDLFIGLLGFWHGTTKILGLQELMEDLSGLLLQFSVDQVLERLSGHLGVLDLVLLALDWGFVIAISLHLLVLRVGDRGSSGLHLLLALGGS